MNTLPNGGLALAALEEQLLRPGVKGLPITEPLRQGAIGVQGWNVLHADTSFPVAILKTSALIHNLDWMRRFCAHHGAILAPHGKTTMSPQLFGAQLANGAWGITLASAAQVQLAHRFGVRRVLLANQLVSKADIGSVLALMHGDPEFEFFALVDSAEGVARLAQAVERHPLARPLPLLVELGLAGKRAGCRSDSDAMALARMVAAAPGLQLAGVEGYEGLLVSPDRAADVAAVNDFVGRLAAFMRAADEEQLFGGAQILLPAGGSIFRPGRARICGTGAARCRGGAAGAAQRLLPDQRPRFLPAPDRRAQCARRRPPRHRRRRPAPGAGSVEHGAVASRAQPGDPQHGQARRLLRHRAAARLVRPPSRAGRAGRAGARLPHRQHERPARLPALARAVAERLGRAAGWGPRRPGHFAPVHHLRQVAAAAGGGRRLPGAARHQYLLLSACR
jgi:hypothetical protein